MTCFVSIRRVLAAISVLLCVSCQPHDPFCFHHPHGVVVVQYDWSKAPDAVGISGTRVFFFGSDDGSFAAVENFEGMDGGVAYVGAGEYDIICYNDGCDKLMYRGDGSLSTFEAYTRDARLTEDLPGFSYGEIPGLVLTPNRIWSGHSGRVKVARNDTTYITLVPQKTTYELIWEVTGIRGANRVKACAVSVSGLGGSLMLSDGKTECNSSLMAGAGTSMSVSNEGIGGFHGEMEIFGCQFDEHCSHELTIYCWSNGGNVKATFDVTGQCHVVKEDRKIYIRIETNLEIPSGGSSGGGFDPSVGGWDEVNEEIII